MPDDQTMKDRHLQPAPVDLARLPRGDLEVMAAAGTEIEEVRRVLRRTGDNVVSEILRGQGTFYEWDHYPAGDVYDSESHSQYYYHAHPVGQRFEREHGHFHSFLRAKGMPAGIQPAALPAGPGPKEPEDALSHLIAISMDADGEPFRLFTVNRWVTAEVWHHGADVCRLLDCFRVDHAQPSWPANRWITAVMALFKPQIRALVELRDRTVAGHQQQHPERDVLEDRDLEVTSYLDISIDRQIRDIEAALRT